jgi:hypothetical protein
MSYTRADGKFADMDDVVVYPKTTLTAAGAVNGSAIEIGDRSCACLELDVSALTASDTLDAKIQTSKDGTGSGLGAWRDVTTFTQKTTAGTERKSFAGLDRFIRAVLTPTDAGGGGISTTVEIKGELKG